MYMINGSPVLLLKRFRFGLFCGRDEASQIPAISSLSSSTDMARISLLPLLVGLISSGSASAATPSVCPVHDSDPVKYISVYNGKPEDLINLAPDDETGKNPKQDKFTLDYIYKDGRVATIRCKYASGAVTDVELKDPVKQCTASRGKSGEVTVQCR
ncbi:STY0301 family protein [Nitrospirillum sp. BR 11752]|uniref:STY0301 family protein n=1 Tax=Nitrospirillum sp. BR 11752 TaxID=3104293 RepID=UPI003FA540B3